MSDTKKSLISRSSKMRKCKLTGQKRNFGMYVHKTPIGKRKDGTTIYESETRHRPL